MLAQFGFGFCQFFNICISCISLVYAEIVSNPQISRAYNNTSLCLTHIKCYLQVARSSAPYIFHSRLKVQLLIGKLVLWEQMKKHCEEITGCLLNLLLGSGHVLFPLILIWSKQV